MRYAMMFLFLCCMITGFTGCGRIPAFSVSGDLAADAGPGNEKEVQRDADISTDGDVLGDANVSNAEDNRKNIDAASHTDMIYVDVCGEVLQPGVYCLVENARVCDAILAAGGFTELAAKEFVNQARVLSDGEQINIPSLLDEQEKDLTAGGEEVSDGLVNINTAEESELMTLPGIGKAKAADIISYRTEHGNFQKKEDLMQVPGIKEGLYQRLKDKIKI